MLHLLQDECSLKEQINQAFAYAVWKYKKKSPTHELMQKKEETKREVGAAEVKKYWHEFEEAKQKEIGSWREAYAVRVEKYNPAVHGEPLPGRWVSTIDKRTPEGKPEKFKERWTIRGDLCPYRGRIDVDS